MLNKNINERNEYIKQSITFKRKWVICVFG